MDQAESLLRRLDAELVDLGLHDRDLVLRLRKFAADTVAEHGLNLTDSADSETISAGVGAAVVVSILDGVSSDLGRTTTDDPGTREQDLDSLRLRLRDLREHPLNVENVGGRALLWRTIRGNRN